MKWQKENGSLIVYLKGEIDHCTAAEMRDKIEGLLSDRSIDELIFDFSEVVFMDSSAVGMIIGRYKTMAARGGKVKARGLYPPVDTLFRMAGLHRIIAQENEGKVEL